MKRKTIDELKQEVFKKYNGEYVVISNKYVNTHTKIKIKHTKCNKEFDMTPANILHGQQCPHCKNERLRKINRASPEEFKEKIRKKYHGEYTILGEYINANTKILVRHNCKNCNNHIYEVTPGKLYNLNRKCPVCANKKIIQGINDIATTHPDLIKYFVNKEDAYKYSHGSEIKTVLKCPDCGYVKKMRISDLIKRGFSCPKCSEGISYPEKIMSNILSQLNIGFKKEYKPQWINNKKYDFYIKDLNVIIETHGEQHYAKGFSTLGGRTLQEEQINDKYKRETALANGIEYYIELDCRESNLEWIKNSILNSELSKLFNLSKVDWLQCAEFANKNIVKEVCNYWNNKRDIELTSRYFDLSNNTIRNYLQKGESLGWSNYSVWCKRKRDYSHIYNQQKKIYCVEMDKIFIGCNQLSRQSMKVFGVKLLSSSICKVCKNKRHTHKGYHFKYVSDLTDEEKLRYNIEEKLKELELSNN